MQVLSLFALIASIGYACAAILIRKDSKKLFWINTVLAVANGGLAIMAFTGVVLPNKQVCYMAAAVSSAEYITQETEIGKAINETSVGLIKDVGKIVHDMANPKKTKVVTVDE